MQTPTVSAVGQPKVTSVQPSFGPISGGNAVTIIGEHFEPTGLTVHFGAALAFNTVVFSPNEIRAIAPAGTGVVDITVFTTTGGLSPNTLADDYSYGQSNASVGVFEFTATQLQAPESQPTFYVTVTRSGGSAGFAQVSYATIIATATAGADYLATSGVLNFLNGQSETSFSVTIINDTLVEFAETFGVALANPTNGTSLGAKNSAVVTIIDDESGAGAGGTIAFQPGSYSTPEGTAATVGVSRSGPGQGSVTVTYQSSPGTASASDFTPIFGTLTWLPGEISTKFVSIQTLQDLFSEGTETVVVTLVNPSNGAVLGTPATALIAIADDDIPVGGMLEFASSEFGVGEGVTTASITVRRLPGANGAPVLTVQYATSDGTAIAAVDYIAAAGTLNFGVGELSKTFNVSFVDDQLIEGNETVRLSLSVATGGALLGAQSVATLTIIDNDTGTPHVTGLDPAAGPLGGGNPVTINGSFLGNATLVAFGGVPASILSNTNNQLSVIAPPRAAAGVVIVQVTTALGTSQFAGVANYTYTSGLPTVNSVTPNSGPASGGTTVVILGQGFTGLIAVTFGGVISQSAIANEPGKITAVAPPNTAGIVDVLVTISLGTSTASASTKFTYTAATSAGYTLSFRWNLVTWGGTENMSVSAALEGRETPDNPATTSVVGRVSAIFGWDGFASVWRAYFPSGGGVPGANDLAVLKRGSAYWIAISAGNNVPWNIVAP